MSRDREKRELREMKRQLKRAGHKKARANAKHRLETAPEEAHLGKDSYGRYTTAHLNGMDRDATRRGHGTGQAPPPGGEGARDGAEDPDDGEEG